MKKIKGIVVFIYLLITVVVLMVQPVVHKPVALENKDFEIKDQLLYPKVRKVSDYEVKVKFTVPHRVAVVPEKDIPISMDNESQRRLSVDFQSNQAVKETTLELNNNTGATQKEITMNTSGVDEKVTNQNFKIDDQHMNYKDKNLNVKDLEINSKDLEIGDRMKASREEIIAWNIWRSDLQNKIMDMSALEAPVGTMVSFSFRVNDKGRISDLRFSCTNKQYAADAQSDLISVLQTIEGTEILVFPKSTQRTQIIFKGAFLLDFATQYSSPSDYSDFERVRQ